MSRRDPRYDLATAAGDYPPRDGAPHRTILLCTHPRSGSTLLGEALYYAGGLGCPLEYFHRGFRPSFERRWQIDPSDTDGYVARVHARRTDPTGTLAVKLFWRDVEDLTGELTPERAGEFSEIDPRTTSAETYRALADALEPVFPQPRYVWLSRRDRVRQAVSALAAEQSGAWRSIPGVEDPLPAEVTYDFERLAALVGFWQYCDAHWTAFFAANRIVPYTLTYEDLIQDYDRTVRPLLRHLGSDAAPATPRLRRQADDAAGSLVVRFLRDLELRASPPG